MDQAKSNIKKAYDLISLHRSQGFIDCDEVYRLLNEARVLLEIHDEFNLITGDACNKLEMLKKIDEYNQYCIMYQHFG
jgi:hypothetical protein